jgi:signal peptide peptidase SppA
MRNLPHLAARMYGVPLMLLPSVADIFGNTLQQILQQPQLGAAEPAAPRQRPHGFASNVPVSRYADKPYIVTDDGVGVLGVYGALLQRWAFDMATCESFASYEVLRYQLDQMQADPDVQAILLEFDSPGGEVAGNFELAGHMQRARGGKPMWAIANEGAYSAAYSLAASTDRIVVPQAGSVGSIGVVMVHVDQSKRDERMGLAYTFIYAGQRKVDFNSHAPLSDKAKALATAEVVRLYDMFVGHVATARALDVQAVRDTEAGVFAANDAKALGLVDAVGNFDDTLAELTDLVRSGSRSVFSPGGTAAATTVKGRTMSDKSTAATPEAAPAPQGVPEAEVAQRVAAAQSEARSGERTRIAAILRAPEAAGRAGLAQALAFDSDMAPEAAAKLLATAAQDAPPAVAASTKPVGPVSPLAAAMASVPNPPVGPDSGASAADPDSPEALAASAIATARSLQGVK